MFGGVLGCDTRMADFRLCPPPLKNSRVRQWYSMSGQVDRQGSGMCMVNVPFDWMSSGHPGIDLSNLPRVHAGTTHLIVCTDRFTRRNNKSQSHSTHFSIAQNEGNQQPNGENISKFTPKRVYEIR
ncbi:hypothetical protein TNCV_1924031 [Trichonephila clavipes]|nr:hypothetical protein TNCV_1924031 [Trichonephila clavipes]